MAKWTMPFFRDEGRDDAEAHAVYDEPDEVVEQERARLDEDDARVDAGQPSPTEAEMAAARAGYGWSQGMEAQPYRVGFGVPSERELYRQARAEWQSAWDEVRREDGRAR